MTEQTPATMPIRIIVGKEAVLVEGTFELPEVAYQHGHLCLTEPIIASAIAGWLRKAAGEIEQHSQDGGAAVTGDQFLYGVIRDDLHLCGCGEGQSEQAAFLVRDILRTLDDGEAAGRSFDRVASLVGNPASAYLVLTLMLQADLVEYGVRITNPWTTENGQRFVTEMDRYKDEEALAGMLEEGRT